MHAFIIPTIYFLPSMVRIVKNELRGSATQQEQMGWGRGWGSQWNEQGNCGVKPPTPVNVNSNPASLLLHILWLWHLTLVYLRCNMMENKKRIISGLFVCISCIVCVFSGETWEYKHGAADWLVIFDWDLSFEWTYISQEENSKRNLTDPIRFVSFVSCIHPEVLRFIEFNENKYKFIFSDIYVEKQIQILLVLDVNEQACVSLHLLY